MQRIRPGVFFEPPPSLPRGRHQLPREEILQAQRERLMMAGTQLLAMHGYRGVGVREISADAQVSRAAFYECFADKDDCVFAAYDRFIEVLLLRLSDAITSGPDWESTVAAVLKAYLTTLQSDLVVARAFQVEMDALGRPARERRRAALTGMAALLKSERDNAWPGAADLPMSAYIGVVYAVRQIASDALDECPDPDLVGLTAELATWIFPLLAAPPPSPTSRPRREPLTAPPTQRRSA